MNQQVINSDQIWMQKALALAQKGEGLTRPNPPVGAIVVRDGMLAGQGYHSLAGGAHAEVIAIGAAREKAMGATLYVTMEPCCTKGKTGPCTDLIIQSGIKRVVIATRDPNPKHKGKGLKQLRLRKIETVEGICSEEGNRLIAPFSKWITTGKPYVTLKLGISLDGKIADYSGTSRWITDSASRDVVQAIRRRSDALVVGAGTVLADDPSLLPRPDMGRRPFRVILDARGSVKLSAQVLNDKARHRTIIATTSACPAALRKKWHRKGASVWILRKTKSGLSLKAFLERMGKQGFLHILCEGGSETAEALIRAGLVDEYIFFIAPRIIGGTSAKSAVGGRGWLLHNTPDLIYTECRLLKKDIMIRANQLR